MSYNPLSRFLQGSLGLPVTFWGCWVLANALFSFLNSQISSFRILIGFNTVITVYAVLALIAVWNAAKQYQGRPLWAKLARIFVVLGGLGVVAKLALLADMLLHPPGA